MSIFTRILFVLICLAYLSGCVTRPDRVENPFEPSSGQTGITYRSLSLGVVLTPNTRNTMAYTDDFSKSMFSEFGKSEQTRNIFKEISQLFERRFNRVVFLSDPKEASSAGVDTVVVLDAYASFPTIAIGTAKMDVGLVVLSPTGDVLEKHDVTGLYENYATASEKILKVYEQILVGLNKWLDGSSTFNILTKAKSRNATLGVKSVAQLPKERLVLMPLRVAEEDKSLEGAMETALVQGLQQNYIVFSGEQVAQKAREIFLKESRNTAKKECDETRCMQGIAEAFQAELIATANVTKRDGGYFLSLSIRNIFDNKVVYSNSVACKGCDTFQVVDKLKELSSQ